MGRIRRRIDPQFDPPSIHARLDMLEGLYDGVLVIGPDGRIRFQTS
jgi:hypothetical protein